MVFKKIVICFVWLSLIKQEKELTVTCSYGLYFKIHFQVRIDTSITFTISNFICLFHLLIMLTLTVLKKDTFLFLYVFKNP